MRQAMKSGVLLVLLAMLGGCGGDPRDVRSEMQALRKDLRGNVAPLPQSPIRLEAAPLQIERDPFGRD